MPDVNLLLALYNTYIMDFKSIHITISGLVSYRYVYVIPNITQFLYKIDISCLLFTQENESKNYLVQNIYLLIIFQLIS